MSTIISLAFLINLILTLKNLLRPISLNNTRALCITATAGTYISQHSFFLAHSYKFFPIKSCLNLFVQHEFLQDQTLFLHCPQFFATAPDTVVRTVLSSNVVVHSPKSTINHRKDPFYPLTFTLEWLPPPTLLRNYTITSLILILSIFLFNFS